MHPESEPLPGIDPKREFPAQPDGAPLRPWHELFHSSYQEQIDSACARLQDSDRPVLIRIDDVLILLYASQRDTIKVAGDAYHRYKTLCHIPLAIHSYLAINDPALLTAAEFDAMGSALDSVDDRERPEPVLDACRDFLADCRTRRVMSLAAVEKLRESYQPAVRLLVQNAADEAVAALDVALKAFESRVSAPQHWSELFCVVCSGHQPRYGELNKQYFRQYLQARNIGDVHWEHRLIYAEGVTEPDKALRLVAQRIVDSRLGAALLGDSVRLNQDILAHAASVALDKPRPARPW